LKSCATHTHTHTWEGLKDAVRELAETR
jgi:hypothetical protein